MKELKRSNAATGRFFRRLLVDRRSKTAMTTSMDALDNLLDYVANKAQIENNVLAIV